MRRRRKTEVIIGIAVLIAAVIAAVTFIRLRIKVDDLTHQRDELQDQINSYSEQIARLENSIIEN